MDILSITFLSVGLSLSKPNICDSQEKIAISVNDSNRLLASDSNGCGKNCIQLGDTVAPPKPEECEIKIYLNANDVNKNYEKLCLLSAATRGGIFSDKSPEAAIKRLKKEACKCGADAVILTDIETNYGSSAQGIGIRFTAKSTSQPISDFYLDYLKYRLF